MLKMYRNLKIQKKLLFGFGMVVVLTFALTSVNLLTMRNIDTTYTNLLDNPVQGLQITQTMQREYVEARRFLLSAAFNADDAEAFNTSINNFFSTVQKIKSLSDTLIASVQKDTDISAEERSGAIAAVQQTATRITVDFNNLGKELETAVKQENATADEVKAIAAAGGKITKEISDELDAFAGLIQSKMKESSDNASKHINFMVLLLSIISIIVYLIAIIIAVGIGKTIRGPIVHLTEAAKKIAGGSLDTPVRMNETDEIGALSNMIGDMVDIFSLLVERINLSYSLLMKGELDVAIDEAVFPGGYKDAASAVNTMVNYLAGNTFLAIQCINEYGKGNFDASMKRFSGPQAVLHESLDGLQSNLKAVNKDIGKLIEKTVIGELDLRIDSKVYEGDWKKMAEGLNKLMEAVETPISEVSGVLERVAKADFSANIKGDYKGRFNIMKIAVNKTVQNTAEYIQDISEILDKMSHQDLDIYITKNYIGDFVAIKNALNQILVAFNGVIGDFSLSAEQVASGANQISESSMTLSQGATEQSSTLEELNATIEAIANQTAENARNTERANSLSSDTKNSGLVGNDEMKEMLKSMSDMEEASMSISKIISVIDGIAFQTNLLALNAAVEAARAGQHGKGFAVVAEEVRSLAGRSQKAASETTELINKTVDIVSNGTKIANRTADSLHKMVEEIAQISTLIDGVSTASKKQNASIQQINEGIRQISEVTQANTATSEESASSAQELFSQAEMLRNTVSKFKLRR